MANLFTDVIAPTATGIGHGVSQGIQDYANIQKIKEQEELAPLQIGLVKSQLGAAQRAEREAAQKEAELNKDWVPMKDPAFKKIYDGATEEGKAYFDNLFPKDRTFKVRDKINIQQQAENDSKLYKHLTEGVAGMIDQDIAVAQNDYNQRLEDINRTPLKSKSAMGFEIDNPEINTKKAALQTSEAQLRELEARKGKVIPNIEEGSRKVAINEMYMNNRELIDSKPSLKMMVDMTKRIGTTADVAKLIEIVAKVKDPVISNEVELFLSTHKYSTPAETWKAWDEYQKTKKAVPTTHIHIGDKSSEGVKATFRNSNSDAVRLLTNGTYQVMSENGWVTATRDDLVGLKATSGKVSHQEEAAQRKREKANKDKNKPSTHKVYNPDSGNFE